MTRGKEKCRILKQIRTQIAEANDIEFVTAECKHKGECKGTCPKCESEVRYLEEQLAKRRALGKRIALAGISVGVSLSMAGCRMSDAITDAVDMLSGEGSHIEMLAGDVPDYQVVGEVEAPPEPIELDGETELFEPDTEDDMEGYIAEEEPND